MKAISRATTAPTPCTTARIAWSSVIVSCPSIESRYVNLSYQQSANLVCDARLALDRFFLRKDFIAGAGPSDPARSPWPIMFLPRSCSELCHRRSIWYPHDRRSILRLPKYIQLCKSYSTAQVPLLPIDHHKATKRVHFRRPQYISSSHTKEQGLCI